MREETTRDKIRQLMVRLGAEAGGPGRVYFTGGATAVLLGWRETTADVDLKFDPEPPGIFAALAAIKEELNVNIELAAPDDFIPALPGWRDRSPFVERRREVDFFHYDLYAQALSKIERGHTQDLADVRKMTIEDLVRPDELRRFFGEIEKDLERFPAIDPDLFRRKVERFLAASRADG